MILTDLGMLMVERRLNATKISKDTGISRTTLGALINNEAQGIQFETLNTLCRYLNIEPGAFFTFVPFDLRVSKLSYFDDTIEFTIIDERSRTKVYSLPFKVEIERKWADSDDEDADDDPSEALIKIGSISVHEEMPTGDEEAFYGYYKRLPVLVKIRIEKEIMQKIQIELDSTNFDDEAIEELGLMMGLNMHVEMETKW